jgi:hypothetical protein
MIWLNCGNPSIWEFKYCSWRIFGPKRDEVRGEWRKLHNEEPSIIRIIKSRMMRWAGHVAWMGEKRNTYRLLVGKPEGKRPLGRPRCRWVDILGWILGRWDGVMWNGLVWPRIGTGVELLWIRYWALGYHEMLGNYRVASRLVLSSI